jgi:hypothetical protein
MNRMRVFNLLLMALGIGFLGGALFMRHLSERTEYLLELARQEDNADISLRALRHLNEDTTNTEPFLQVQLDNAIVGLGRLVEEVPAPERDKTAMLMLAKIRDYRARFPRKSQQPGLDEEIARSFGMLDEKR